MSLYLGVDIGALTVKVALVDAEGRLVYRAVRPGGYQAHQVARDLVREGLREAGWTPQGVQAAVVTGYGRVLCDLSDLVARSEQRSEISCHALGVHHLLPQARTVIDIGGQDSKVIRVNGKGQVLDFAMNDRCAAGTGRFLEVMAQALGVPLEELGPLALQARDRVAISSTCTVFAESEVVSHLARGADRAAVAAGLHEAIALRIKGLAARVGVEPEVVLTGGVAQNPAVVEWLGRVLGRAVAVPPEPQVTGALGAALYARSRAAQGG
ncbi:MAG: 2-hydroxyglutaryl-CoA dehydratase [Anaerolineae bacterium]|nr:2-hydroxyglutaryl-CoA dehydratase [Anaerolineae bacterium]